MYNSGAAPITATQPPHRLDDHLLPLNAFIRIFLPYTPAHHSHSFSGFQIFIMANGRSSQDERKLEGGNAAPAPSTGLHPAFYIAWVLLERHPLSQLF